MRCVPVGFQDGLQHHEEWKCPVQCHSKWRRRKAAAHAMTLKKKKEELLDSVFKSKMVWTVHCQER